MVKQGIQIYARVKPTKSKTGQYELFQDEGQQESGIAFTVPRDMADGYINNKREVYQFRFNKVFNQASKQEEIFENVAQGVIDNVLAGYNGTIFAYGQTGSGKTFTITGGAERYSDRGLIPRSLSYIFEFYEQNSDVVHTTHVSYLEIYNENGYDLLDPKHEASKLEDLPKVNLLEDSDGNIHLKNLSLHPANNEEEALNLLFLGDTNRMIAETPMNQASTRSHCIFTIHISSRETGSATIRRAKLHLVDLAGSERVGKTNVGGTLLTEAKYINLSLHYLEQVIVALSEKSRSHIPYRNSMMTAVLRDSLGGNCMTTMIATCAVEKKNIDESISTCRFAQRVAMIKNDVSLNEEIDPKLMIAQLKKEIQRLKADLAMATGQEYTGELTEDDIERLKLQVKAFIEDTDTEASLNVGADMRKIEYSFLLLKEHALRKGTNSSPPSRTSVIEGAVDSSYLANQSEVSKLKELIKQRDNEINILVSMLKKEKKRAADADSALKHAGKGMGNSAALGTSRSGSQASAGDEMESDMYRYRPVRKTHVPERASIDTLESRIQPRAEERERTRTPSAYHKRLEEMSVGRKEAFEVFRRDYVHNDTIEENKKTLKQRYGEAKSLGEQVNTSRHRINVIKGQLEQHRVRRSMQGLVNGEENIEEDDPHEQRLKSQIEQEKATYKESFTKLRSMKTEIEHLQHLLEKAKVKMQKDFEIWWAEQASQTPSPLSQPPEEVKSAWRTPPISPLRAPQDKSRPNLANRRRGDNDERLSTSGTSKYAARLRAEAQLASSGVNHFLPSKTNTFGSSSENQRNGEGNLRSKTILSGEERVGQQNTAMSSRGSSNIPLTGDSRTDADIVAFMKARQNVLQQQGRR